GFDAQKEADRVLLARYTPPGVLVNESGDILAFRGRTSPYLEPAPGQASLNLQKMAREGLHGELRSAFQAAKKANGPIHRKNVVIRQNGHSRTIDLEIIPIKSPPMMRERHFLILFKEMQATRVIEKEGKGTAKAQDKAQRRREQ